MVDIGADSFIRNTSDELASDHATQRYQRGFSDVDMWNLDCFIADVIAAGCQWYIDHGKTCPWEYDVAGWKAILAEIRDGFSYRDPSGEPNPPKSAWKLLKNNFHHLWD